jgi:hypothetical protein
MGHARVLALSAVVTGVAVAAVLSNAPYAQAQPGPSTCDQSYPIGCTPEELAERAAYSRGYYRAYGSVVGGFNSTGVNGAFFTSTDTLAAIPTRTVDVNSSNTSGAFGFLGTIVLPNIIAPSGPRTPITVNGKPSTLEQAGLTQSGVDVLIRSGFIKETSEAPSDPVSFLGTFPLGTGFVKDPPTWTVPLLAGVSIPARWLGWNMPGLSFELLGGVNFNHRNASISLTEPGAGPGGLAVNASKTWTSTDPALGIGFQYRLGNFAGLPLSFGTTAIFDWTKAQTLRAQSPNFPSQSYALNTGSQRDTLVLFSLSVDLFAPPAPAPYMPVKARLK